MATLNQYMNYNVNVDPYVHDTSYSGMVYAFYATGGFTMDQCFNTIKLLPETELRQYDVTQAVQVLFDVRKFNEKLGLYKDDNNRYVTSTTFNIITDTFPIDSISISSQEFVNGMTAPQVISVGSYSSMYSDYTQFVNTYFGYAGGFSSLFANASEFNVNNGVFDSNAFIYLLNSSQDPSGAQVLPVTGSITINNINQLLRFAVNSNVFNNRKPGTAIIKDSSGDILPPDATITSSDYLDSTIPGNATASDMSGSIPGILQNMYQSDYGTFDGFVAGDLFFIPAGTTVGLHVVVDSELLNPLNNIGPTNVLNLILNSDYSNKYGISTENLFTQTSTASISNIDRVLTAPLFIKLANLSTTTEQTYNSLYLDSNGNPTDIYVPAN